MRVLVVDTETTGIDSQTDTVLELAGVDPFGVYRFESLCYFDKGFFDKAIKVDCDWIDTLRVAKHLLPEAPGFSTQVLRYYLNLEVKVPEGLAPHRAFYDTLVTAKLFRHLGGLLHSRLKEAGQDHHLGAVIPEMIRLSSAPAILHRLTFGKHKGKTFAEVRRIDPGYLRWMSNAADIDADARYTAVTLLRQR